jgi:phosphoribosylformylglycinamidine cyclo-ligase
MGHRMEIFCEPEAAEAIIAQSESFGIPAQVVGRTEVTQRDDGQNHVTIQHDGKTLEYSIDH